MGSVVKIQFILQNRIIVLVHSTLALILLIVPRSQGSPPITHSLSKSFPPFVAHCLYFREFRGFRFSFGLRCIAFLCLGSEVLLRLSFKFLVCQFELVYLVACRLSLLITTFNFRHLFKSL